ncbi:MAG: ABC transporter permease subunit [Phycisphaerae bacterium]|nr:ABC transporter permease subunit [Phycisphaerae bacterium]
MGKLFTIAKNTFTEAIRQPVYSAIIITALLLIFLSPSLTMYTMSEDNKLLRELGLSTLFLAGLFVAIFSASGAVAEEIENKTITTVMTKPVKRPIFIIAKFLGICAAIALAHYICTIALLMAIRHGVLETASDTHDRTVIAATAATVGLTLILTAFLNYIYDWKFSSTAIVLLAFFATISIIFLAFIDRDWKFNPAGNGINTLDVCGSILLLFGMLIMAALAVAFSTRFNTIITLCLCLGIFLLGLISAYIFSRFAEQYFWAKAGKMLIPDLQVFWISDAIYEGSPVPLKYLYIVASYAICYSAGIISLAIAAFQRRQVG